MTIKNNNAYKSIGEVAKILNLVNKKKGTLNTHTIRFWEKEFKQIKPKILNGNRRYYNNETIETLKKVKYLLKDQGMTINGVKKVLNSDKSLKYEIPFALAATKNIIKNSSMAPLLSFGGQLIAFIDFPPLI